MQAYQHEGTGEVTRLLVAARGGDRVAADRILPLVYDDLRRLARRHLRREMGERTIQATELVHEAYLKFGGSALGAADRSHFLALASHAMRQVLVDHARHDNAAKRGGGGEPITLSAGHAAAGPSVIDVLALDQALDRLGELSERLRRIVEYIFFGGMTHEEVAAILGVSTRTVERDWLKAKLFLHRELEEGNG